MFCFSGSPFTIDVIDMSSSRLVEERSTTVYNSEEPVMVNMEKHLMMIHQSQWFMLQSLLPYMDPDQLDVFIIGFKHTLLHKISKLCYNLEFMLLCYIYSYWEKNMIWLLNILVIRIINALRYVAKILVCSCHFFFSFHPQVLKS